ncbi:MAG: hypothetical protein JXB48_21815 [Candidatus Latescibacteria bacterium]|nr:hypothetical protein [Candidatus Latescibacterota bacterium]
MRKQLLLIALIFTFAMHQMPQAQQETTKKTQADSTVQADDLSDFSRTLPQYESGGRRDPFGSLAPKVTEDEDKIKDLFNYEGSELRGIVKSDIDTYALVIDSDGFAHVLREGYMVYGGYVTQITDNSVYLHIVKYGRALSIILRLETSKSTVIAEEAGDQVIKRPGINIIYEKSMRPQRDIRLEDIVVPSINTKTIDEQWFGKKNVLPVLDRSTAITQEIEYDSFSLFDPPSESWITLPYLMNWTDYSGERVAYKLIIADNSDFTKPVLIREEIESSSYLLIESMDLPSNTLLFWKVIAINKSGSEILSRQTFLSFKIKGNQ